MMQNFILSYRGFKEQNHFTLVILYILKMLFCVTFTNGKNMF